MRAAVFPEGTLVAVRLLGIDIGTTACKAIAIDEQGAVLDTVSAEYPLDTPRPGWTEQNPEDWARAARACIDKLSPHDAIGFTGQMHGSVFLDGENRVIRPALLWNDARTVKEVDEIVQRVGMDEMMRITRNPPLAGFQAPKILWLRNNEPQSYKLLRTVLLPKDYVRFAITGEIGTDVSDASGTAVFDVPSRTWSTPVLERLELPPSFFPECNESVRARGAGDQAAGAVGTGAVTPEIVSVSLGTSGVVFGAQDEPSFDSQGRLHTFCHANGKWHSMGVMLSCGGALKWVRDTFGFASYDEMAKLAQEARRSQSLFKPYLAGERTPHNNPNLRASFEGLSLSDGRTEIARSTFEGITSGLVDGFNLLVGLRGVKPSAVRVTGGGAKSDYWMQLIANVFGVPAMRLQVDEGPAFGAAILAGVGIGVWSSVESACEQVVKTDRGFEPVAQLST